MEEQNKQGREAFEAWWQQPPSLHWAAMTNEERCWEAFQKGAALSQPQPGARLAPALKALDRLARAVDWHLGRIGFTQTDRLKGVEYSATILKELYAAHDEARTILAKAKGEQA